MHRMQVHNSQLVWTSNRRGNKLGLYGGWVTSFPSASLHIKYGHLFSKDLRSLESLTSLHWRSFGNLLISLWCLSQPLEHHLDVNHFLCLPMVHPKEWFDVLCRLSTSLFWCIPSIPEGHCCHVFFTIFLASSWILNVTVTYPCLTTLCHL